MPRIKRLFAESKIWDARERTAGETSAFANANLKREAIK